MDNVIDDDTYIAIQKSKIKEREAKWDDFFERYGNVGEEDDESDYAMSEIGLSDGTEEREEDRDDYESDEGKNENQNGMAIGNIGIDQTYFEQVFQQQCKQTHEYFEHTYEKLEIDGKKRTQIREHKIASKSTNSQSSVMTPRSATKEAILYTPNNVGRNRRGTLSGAHTTEQLSANTPKHSTPANFGMIKNNNDMTLALQKAQPGTLMEPNEEVLSSEIIREGGVVMIQEVMTTTTTTTMTRRTIIQQEQPEMDSISVSDGDDEDSHIDTVNENTKENKKSTKRRTKEAKKTTTRSSSFSTPSSNRIKSAITKETVLYTPDNSGRAARRVTLSRKHIEKQCLANTPISRCTPAQRKNIEKAARSIRVNRDERVVAIETQGIKYDSDEDPMASDRTNQRTIIQKTRQG